MALSEDSKIIWSPERNRFATRRWRAYSSVLFEGTRRAKRVACDCVSVTRARMYRL